jgi:hypothetical protein
MLAPGTVVDADPRTISNLIADQTLNNPAAISAALTYAGITGAAQMTAISQIQAARAAITNAGTGVGNIPSLEAAVDAAEAALSLAQADRLMKLDLAAQADTAYQTALDDIAPLQQTLIDAQALLGGLTEESEGYAEAVAAVDLAQQAVDNMQSVVDAALVQVGVSSAAIEVADDAVLAKTTALDAAEDALAVAQTASQAVTVAETALANLLNQLGIQMDGNTVLIPNVAPDIGDSAPYNSLFTLFGQFFDHGLDLISKGGSGTVYIPLQPDDPLYVPGSHSNFMVMTRASRDGDGDTINTTTPWVDQNQTYTSHASHQVFLRE